MCVSTSGSTTSSCFPNPTWTQSGLMAGEPAREKPNRKGLFIGASYPGSSMNLPYCAQDAKVMKAHLCKRYEFIDDAEHIKVLMDEGEDSRLCGKPTKSNIRDAIGWLVHEAVPGDSLFFFFSGHGSQQPNLRDMEKDGFDEAT